MLLNLVIAVILENFSCQAGSGERVISDDVINHYREEWERLDPKGKGNMKSEQLMVLLRRVSFPLGFQATSTSLAPLLSRTCPDHSPLPIILHLDPCSPISPSLSNRSTILPLHLHLHLPPPPPPLPTLSNSPTLYLHLCLPSPPLSSPPCAGPPVRRWLPDDASQQADQDARRDANPRPRRFRQLPRAASVP